MVFIYSCSTLCPKRAVEHSKGSWKIPGSKACHFPLSMRKPQFSLNRRRYFVLKIKVTHSPLKIRVSCFLTSEPGPSQQSDAFIRLDTLIDQFRSNFPLVDYLDSRPSSKETLLVTQMMAHVATIKLHQPLSDGNKQSRHKSLFSAQSIATLTRDLTLAGSHQLNPIVGVSRDLVAVIEMQSLRLIVPLELGLRGFHA